MINTNNYPAILYDLIKSQFVINTSPFSSLFVVHKGWNWGFNSRYRWCL